MEIDKSIEPLIKCLKLLEEPKNSYRAPLSGCHLNLKLISPEIPEERFLLDIYEGARRSSMSLKVETGRKNTFQTRRSSQPLVRVDIDEKALHANPDGTLIRGSHIHIASTRYGARFAFPLNSEEGVAIVGSEHDPLNVFEGFRRFCNIDDNLMIVWGLGF